MRYQIYEAKSVKYDAQQRVGITKNAFPRERRFCALRGFLRAFYGLGGPVRA